MHQMSKEQGGYLSFMMGGTAERDGAHIYDPNNERRRGCTTTAIKSPWL